MRNFLFLALILGFFCYSCEDNKKETNMGPPFDPGKPVKITNISPKEGGKATRMILSGENFGNDKSIVKVFYNDRPAPVIGCNNGKILVITPKQPGDTCTISVEIEKDGKKFSDSCAEKFIYRISTVVTTLVGQKGTDALKIGSFAEATFVGRGGGGGDRGIRYLAVDTLGHLFLSYQDKPSNCILMIDQDEMTVSMLYEGTGNRPNAPTVTDAQVVVVPADGGGDWKDVFWEFNPFYEWAPKVRRVAHPTKQQQDALGIKDFTLNEYKHSFAYCAYDSMVYYRSNRNGALIKFNPVTLLGQAVTIDGESQVLLNTTADSYLVFDPHNPTRLYAVCCEVHRIYYFDIVTGEQGIYVGRSGQSGWRDGKVEDALFNRPRQIIVDSHGDVFVADSENHCIRKIDTKTGIVSTVIGIPGKKGYQDGNKTDALFAQPWGLAIDKDDAIYVVDCDNQCIRKFVEE